MLKDLINFFENAPLDEVTSELKKYNIEFIENNVEKYNNILIKSQKIIFNDSYNATVNSKLTYKKVDNINTDYNIDTKCNIDMLYSEFGIGDAA
ncbi:hypothetical protein ACEE21_02470 [Clostridium baratii]|uniref:hypothetical protein n=1 Tax=Clostridium baratii TaxID=1561 RepID=UPI002A762B21|nr:hypothetical protein [Clostridium baratii]MDY3208425.1 hypothetical protein [Clostridium baratii]